MNVTFNQAAAAKRSQEQSRMCMRCSLKFTQAKGVCFQNVAKLQAKMKTVIFQERLKNTFDTIVNTFN